MAEQRHTAGPWQFYADLPSTEPNWHIVTNESRLRVLANVYIEPGNEMDLANARLIAAAPDLLEAANVLLRDIQDWPTIHEGGDYLHGGMTLALRTAIAKAEGRQL